jgi:putative colanic acid biosynthesis UDP-glucose lipid carrier transferase
LYVSWRGEKIEREIRKITLVWAATLILVQFFLNYVFYSQYYLNTEIFYIWGGATWGIFVTYRVFVRFVLRKLRLKGMNRRYIVIAGAGDLGKSVADKITENPWMGFDLLGFYDDKQTEQVAFESGSCSKSVSVLGDLDALIADAKCNNFDRIYLALPMRAESVMIKLVNELADSTASVYLVPDIFTFELLHARSEMVNGLPTISIFESPMDGSNAIVKRLEDIFLTLAILCMISVPMIFIAIAIRITSQGPVFFKQKRYGLDGQPIEVWKFRSMKVMENGHEIKQAKRNDSRLTPIGGFLRRTSLDELPQFFNVLKGDMSIVGPRPHAIVHNEQYRKLIKGYMLRHKVKPGITGWAQVNGWRGETDTLEKMEKRIEFDLDYIRRWSFWLDIKIIALTVFKGFINKNAY